MISRRGVLAAGLAAPLLLGGDMRRSEDLAPLLGVQPAGSVGCRQGVIRTWDPLTAANTVEVAGAVLTNLPVLSGSDVVGLAAGDVVNILTVASGGTTAYFIIGRIITPPSSGIAPTAVAFGGFPVGGGGSVSGWSLGTVDTFLINGAVSVPSWCNQVALIGVASTSVVNSNGSSVHTYLSVVLNGLAGAEVGITIPPGPSVIGSLTASDHRVVNSPPASIPVATRQYVTTAVTSHAANVVTLNVVALFGRV